MGMESRLVYLGVLLTIAGTAVIAHALRDSIEPLPPLWPETFQIEFKEENYLPFYTLNTEGTYYYDFAHRRTRVDRENGMGDRYCGSAYPLRNTPCTHLVAEGMRYLLFPEYKYCCKCCSDSGGCGAISPDWLANATYLGIDTIYGQKCRKWNQPGLQNNFYWQTLDDIPMRIYMEYLEQMTFLPDSFVSPARFNETLFELPTNMDCSPSCYGACSLLSSNQTPRAAQDQQQEEHQEGEERQRDKVISLRSSLGAER